jgi:hypothetical protein
MEKKDISIFSYTGSGVTWLLNFFIEIDILVYHGIDSKDVWNFNEKRQSHILKKKEETLTVYIPTFLEKKEFVFRDNLAIKWSHEFPNCDKKNQKTILLVRDGRDTIYSQFKREKIYKNFLDMLNGVSLPLNLPYPETWALFNYLWLKVVKKENLFIIKFAELKTNPMPVLKELLRFIGIERSDEEIARAIEQSSFDKAKKAEAEYRKENANVGFTLVNRGGKIGEWRQIYNNEELNHFKNFPNEVLGTFGYEKISQEEIKPVYIEKTFFGTRKTKKKIVSDLKHANEDAVLVLGRKALCLEWLTTLQEVGNEKRTEGTEALFAALIEACERMPETPYLKIEIAKALGNLGAHTQALRILDGIDVALLSDAHLTERGKVYALNCRFREARRDILRAGHHKWFTIIFREKFGKFTPRFFLRKILPMNVRRSIRSFLTMLSPQ